MTQIAGPWGLWWPKEMKEHRGKWIVLPTSPSQLSTHSSGFCLGSAIGPVMGEIEWVRNSSQGWLVCCLGDNWLCLLKGMASIKRASCLATSCLSRNHSSHWPFWNLVLVGLSVPWLASLITTRPLYVFSLLHPLKILQLSACHLFNAVNLMDPKAYPQPQKWVDILVFCGIGVKVAS